MLTELELAMALNYVFDQKNNIIQKRQNDSFYLRNILLPERHVS